MNIPRGDAVALTRALVQVDSRNPSLVADAPGEARVARVLADALRAWGIEADVVEAAPGRPNVIARVGTRRADAPALMFNGHIDVVGVEGMRHEPFAALEVGGRMYGRGSSDMKAGVAAMCAAAARADLGDGAVIIAAVCDEEYASAGALGLLASGVRADAAIVTEPTTLAIAPAHRGFAWIEVVITGRAAHGSRYELGVDAIRHAGLLLAELDALDAGPLGQRTHPLLGRASLHASLISGGIGMSTYPDRCVLHLERRTLPGESAEDAFAEVRDACERVRARRPTMMANVRPMLAQPPSDVPTDAPVVRALGAALTACGEPVRTVGMSAWTDAALLNDAGIPAICFGPGDIALAHAAEEWVDVREIERAATVLTALASQWSRGAGAWRS